nr:hypothetical protein [Streptomyces hygroscopicus]
MDDGLRRDDSGEGNLIFGFVVFVGIPAEVLDGCVDVDTGLAIRIGVTRRIDVVPVLHSVAPERVVTGCGDELRGRTILLPAEDRDDF